MPNAEDAPFDRLPDDSVVVRGGLMFPADLARGVQSHFDTEGVYALSVFSAAGRTADEIAIAVPLPHPKIRTSTVGRVRVAGYDVVSSPGPPGHADLLFREPPTDDDWRTMDRIFDPPRANPATIGTDDV